MWVEFKNYYGLKRYLTVVVQNNSNDIRDIESYDGYINCIAMQRIGHKDKHENISFTTTPKIFADYRYFTKDSNGNQIIDSE